MAVETLAKVAADDPGATILLTKPDGLQSPLVNITRQHAAEMVRYANELGLDGACALTPCCSYQRATPAREVTLKNGMVTCISSDGVGKSAKIEGRGGGSDDAVRWTLIHHDRDVG